MILITTGFIAARAAKRESEAEFERDRIRLRNAARPVSPTFEKEPT